MLIPGIKIIFTNGGGDDDGDGGDDDDGDEDGDDAADGDGDRKYLKGKMSNKKS